MRKTSNQYYFQGRDFVIENYAEKSAFTDFLPAVAGVDGRPLWAFYCNRGQGIAGFGVRGKECPIMEFSPAEIAYETAPRAGFRTFLKIDGKYREPFEVGGNAKTKMLIRRFGFAIEEKAAGKYRIRVQYFGVPHENYSALARIVTYTNLSKREQRVEILDGLARMLPFGMSNAAYKFTGNLLKSWACVEGTDEGYAFARMRSSSADTTEVCEVKGGNFFVPSGGGQIIVDPQLVFGEDKTKTRATVFERGITPEMLGGQATENEFACAFVRKCVVVPACESVTVAELIGYADGIDKVRDLGKTFSVESAKKMCEDAEEAVESIASIPDTHTAYPLWDEYVRQSYFDNVLRGGMPVAVGDKTYYVYSRKHGDPERDYNDFAIEPQAYSCGNGNFRDVAQNRRNDIFFTPVCGDENIRYFFSLIQPDGYNPLSVSGVKFRFSGEVPEKYAHAADLLASEFTVGELCNRLGRADSAELAEILSGCESVYGAKFGEGYWTDHFVYLIDLVTAYLAVYPERKDELLYRTPLKWFVSGARVLPMREKAVLRADGQVRRYGGVEECGADGWATDESGELYRTNLATKLLFLSAVKLATLDPIGAGVDMEAGKPGWNDATNGLPAVFGSNVADSLELLRLTEITASLLAGGEGAELCAEQGEFLENMLSLLRSGADAKEFYFRTNEYKEVYRAKIYGKISSSRVKIPASDAAEFLRLAAERLREGQARAKALDHGMYPTYMRFEVTDYELMPDGKHVIPRDFRPTVLPIFAESVAKGLTLGDHDLYAVAKETDLYDSTLGVFRTSESLENESCEIGRIRSFPRGWLERESCFLHMHYKVLLSMLSAGLYDEYFAEIRTGLVPNMDPERYGRSPVQNSSFIVTTNHADSRKWGKGYQARLTGANAEVLSMWRIMMGLEKPFTVEDGVLKFALTPVIPADFFDKGRVSFKLFGKTQVTYINDGGIDTYRAKSLEYRLKGDGIDDRVREVTGVLAEKVRSGEIREIEVYIK